MLVSAVWVFFFSPLGLLLTKAPLLFKAKLQSFVCLFVLQSYSSKFHITSRKHTCMYCSQTHIHSQTLYSSHLPLSREKERNRHSILLSGHRWNHANFETKKIKKILHRSSTLMLQAILLQWTEFLSPFVQQASLKPEGTLAKKTALFLCVWEGVAVVGSGLLSF